MSTWNDELAARPPKVVVIRTGRWLHTIHINHGLMQVGDWYAFGAQRARRKADRELRRYIRRQQYLANPTVIQAQWSRSGTHVVSTSLKPGHTPPSALMNPNAKVTQADTEEAP